MAIKKYELSPSIWTSCDELRGSVGVSHDKDDVLMFLVARNMPDKYTADMDCPITVPQGELIDNV